MTLKSVIRVVAERVAPSYVGRLRTTREVWRPVALPELDRGNVSVTGTDAPDRINLVLPPFGPGSMFGGLLTVLEFIGYLARDVPELRLIVAGPRCNAGKLREGAQTLSGLPSTTSITVAFLDDAQSIEVHAKDRFVCTTWRTARLAQQLLELVKPRLPELRWPLVYFIQDYEPGFYPWSSEYALARATYEWSDPWVAVVNSNSLCDYFMQRHKSAEAVYSFPPIMSSALLKELGGAAQGKFQKENLILLYGRPSTPRNAFALAVSALECWAREYSESGDWRVVSLGERHPDIRLRAGPLIESKGKVSLAEYAGYLAKARVGLALMLSPHPSYPPLEMAACGVRVITNKFEEKNWNSPPENIYAVDSCQPIDIGGALVEACARSGTPQWGLKDNVGCLARGEDAFGFVEELAKTLGLRGQR